MGLSGAKDHEYVVTVVCVDSGTVVSKDKMSPIVADIDLNIVTRMMFDVLRQFAKKP